MKLLITLFLSCVLIPHQEVREWSSADGNYKIVAELVSYDGTTVKLKKKDGDVVSVEASRLSDADQEFLKKSKNDTPTSMSKEAERELRNDLTEKGLRFTRGTLTLLRETDLSKRLSASKGLMKSLQQSSRILNNMKASEDEWKYNQDELRVLNVNLNAQLANVASVAENNRLVGALNANRSQIKLIDSNLDRLAEEAKQQRLEFNKLREEYIAFVLELRKISDGIEDEITNAVSNQEIKAAIEKIKTESGADIELTKSKSFVRAQKKLKELEERVLSETISLRKDGGGTLRVTATFNGEGTLDMVLDSGASLILLTQQNANELGITIGESAPTIIMTVADGRQIQGKQIFLKSLRIGKFTVENVEAAVLEPSARFAEPLLGMSFLSNFKFEVDAQAETLTMVRISEDK